jgi:L-serine dehydratase
MPRSVFEIIGPAMIGPSSSHTAGAVRIGLLGRYLLGDTPRSATVSLHGSFAATGQGHATDRGIAAGILGWPPDDDRLKDSLSQAADLGIDLRFQTADLGDSVHPNSARLELSDAAGLRLDLIASSIGGGSIESTSIDGFPIRLEATLDTLVLRHEDRSGFLARVTSVLACVEANIATIRTARTSRGAGALTVVELDAPPPPEVPALLAKTRYVSRLRLLPPLP